MRQGGKRRRRNNDRPVIPRTNRQLRHRALRLESLETRCLFDCSLTVTTNGDAVDDTDSVNSFREAILCSNSTVGLDTIAFNIPGAGIHTISPATALPTITDPVFIDGYSQPGSALNTSLAGINAVLQIELSGISAGAGADGLLIVAGDSTVRGLAINGFGGDGIRLTTKGRNTIIGNFLGTSASGAVSNGNNDGIQADGSCDNVIGRAAAADRNLISLNNDDGIDFRNGANGNIVRGNLIGTDVTGILDQGNSDEGLEIQHIVERHWWRGKWRSQFDFR